MVINNLSGTQNIGTYFNKDLDYANVANVLWFNVAIMFISFVTVVYDHLLLLLQIPPQPNRFRLVLNVLWFLYIGHESSD